MALPRPVYPSSAWVTGWYAHQHSPAELYVQTAVAALRLEDATMQQTSLSLHHLIAQSHCENGSIRKMERFKGEMEKNAQLSLPQ